MPECKDEFNAKLQDTVGQVARRDLLIVIGDLNACSCREDHKKDRSVYMAFVDLEKAYDNAKRLKL